MPAETPTPLPACPTQQQVERFLFVFDTLGSFEAQHFALRNWGAFSRQDQQLPDPDVVAVKDWLAAWSRRVTPDAGAWRTMESAPRDGSVVLLFDGQYIHTGNYWEGKTWGVLHQATPIYPTHWQPLPSPPQVTP